MAIVFFSFVAALTFFSALAVAWQKNLLYSAFLLLVTFIGVACLFLTANADFLAVTQILIYVGGILTLFLFGILITKRRENRFLTTGIKNNKLGIVLAFIIGSLLIYIITIDEILVTKKNIQTSSTHFIGRGIIGDYLLPFELSGVLLLVVLVGTLVISSSIKENS